MPIKSKAKMLPHKPIRAVADVSDKRLTLKINPKTRHENELFDSSCVSMPDGVRTVLWAGDSIGGSH